MKRRPGPERKPSAMTFENKITLGYLASLALLLAMGWGVYRTNAAFIESNRSELRSQIFLKELESAHSLVETAESGMRGYVISGQEKFLEQYHQANSRIVEKLEYLSELAEKGGRQEGQLGRVGRLVEEKMAFASVAVQLVRRGNRRAARDTVASAHGKELMDEIRMMVAEIEASENESFEQSERRSMDRSRDAIISRLAMIALSLLLLTGGYLLIMADVSKRRRAEAGLVRAGEDLRRLARRQEAIREEERGRLSRELHDELGQTLTMLQIQAKLLEGRLGGSPARRRDIRRLRASVENAMSTVKRLSLDLRPPMLDDLGIAAAAEWLVKDFCRKAGLRHRVSVEPESLSAPPDVEAALFRILQEAMTNAARHARAGLVTVSLSAGGGWYRLAVSDDGRGFGPATAGARTSLGIMGMRERAGACGGTLEITSRPGRGTTVEVRIPAVEKGEG